LAVKIAILGGTGDLGTGLARRWASAGHPLVIGSRSQERALEAVSGLRQTLADRSQMAAASIEAMDNEGAAQAAEIVVLTVPYAHQAATLVAVREMLAGKILVDTTVPLVPPKVGTVKLHPEGSAAVAAQRLLGAQVQVVSAFHNVSAWHLKAEHELDCDVLVCGDDPASRQTVIGLVEAAGMRGFHAGPLINSVAAETLTCVLLNINRRHKCHSGLRISGL